MDANAEYIEACHPQEIRILGRTLRGLTYGHLVALYRAESPLVSGSNPPLDADYFFALWLCSLKPHKAIKRVGKRLPLRAKPWAFLVQFVFRIQPESVAPQLDRFFEYIRDGLKEVELWRVQTGSKSSACPLLLSVKRVLMNHYHHSEREVIEMPFRKLRYEFEAYQETEGLVEFMSDAQRDHKRRVKEANAKLKAENK